MNGLTGIEIVGIGTITIALIGLFLRIWTDTSKRTNHFIDITTQLIEKTTEALEKQSASNKEVVECMADFRKIQDEHYKLLKKLNGEIAEILRKKK